MSAAPGVELSPVVKLNDRQGVPFLSIFSAVLMPVERAHCVAGVCSCVVAIVVTLVRRVVGLMTARECHPSLILGAVLILVLIFFGSIDSS